MEWLLKIRNLRNNYFSFGLVYRKQLIRSFYSRGSWWGAKILGSRYKNRTVQYEVILDGSVFI